MNQVLIIGGTGNISSEVSDALYKKGYEVTLVTSGRRDIPSWCSTITVDRFNRSAFFNALRGKHFDTVINFLGFTYEDCEADYAVFKGNISQYIFISSATVYQKPHTILPITESIPRGNPFSEYAQKKIVCEEYLEKIQCSEFPVTIVRPSHTFGHTWIPSPINGADFTVASRIIKGKQIIVHDKGESLWTLTASSDFAFGLSGLVGRQDTAGEKFRRSRNIDINLYCRCSAFHNV